VVSHELAENVFAGYGMLDDEVEMFLGCHFNRPF